MDENCIYWYIQVYVVDLAVYTCIYHYSYPVTGFRGGHRNAAVLNKSPRREILVHAQRMKSFFGRPDAAGMKEAIGEFLDGLEGQALDGLLQSLTISCKTTWLLVNLQPLAVWSGSPSFSEG
jgi:hypothetical protein